MIGDVHASEKGRI